MLDKNWRDPACLQKPAHGIAFEKNRAVLEQAVRQGISWPKYSPKSNEQTRERC